MEDKTSDIKWPTVKTDNISCQHQSDLLNKLKIAVYPLFNDKVARKLIEEEIEKRKKEDWDYNDSYN